jgi:hypothetical protein
MSKRSNKNRGPQPVADQGTSVATEALTADSMTREQMLEHMRAADPDVDYAEIGDVDLREFVKASLAEAYGDRPPDEEDDAPVEALAASDGAPADEAHAGMQLSDAALSAGIEQIAAEQPDKPADEVSSVAAAETSGKDEWEGVSPAAKETIQKLQGEIAALNAKSNTKRVASGSKARPNVVYTLLKKQPAWHNTPQVAQLEQIIFNPEVDKLGKRNDKGQLEITEPVLFELIKAGKEAGILRTRQDAVRIFQYYRSELLAHGVLLWQ